MPSPMLFSTAFSSAVSRSLHGELALGLARAALQLFLHREYRLHRLVRREQRFEDDLFVNDLGAALEHHDRLGAGRDDERHVAAFELGVRRIDDDFALDPAHPD